VLTVWIPAAPSGGSCRTELETSVPELQPFGLRAMVIPAVAATTLRLLVE